MANTARSSAYGDGPAQHSYHCACGRVAISVTGEPVSQCLCHCGDCQLFTQQDVFACMLFPAAKVSITSGDNFIKQFSLREPALQRGFCQVRFYRRFFSEILQCYLELAGRTRDKAGLGGQLSEVFVLRMRWRTAQCWSIN